MKAPIKLLFILSILIFSCSLKKEETSAMRALLITGNDHPAHKWQETTPIIRNIMERDSLTEITITENPSVLATVSTEDYDFLILNFCNWKDSSGLSDAAKTGFINYLENGGGLLVLHFSNGAYHFSLPEAGESDWPEYRNIVHQVWDHSAESTHDPFGKFTVGITEVEHFITKDIPGFVTVDELYYNQVGKEKRPALFTAVSQQTGKAEPLAWVYSYKNARIFQSLLGHGPESYESEPYQEILRRAAVWVSED